MKTLANGNPHASSSGQFIKAAELSQAKAIIIEPKKIDYDKPGFQGQGTENHAIVNLTLFNHDALQGKAEPVKHRNAVLTNVALVSYCEDLLEGGTPASVAACVQGVAKPGKSAPWIFQAVEDAIFKRVVSWVESQAEDDEPADGKEEWDD